MASFLKRRLKTRGVVSYGFLNVKAVKICYIYLLLRDMGHEDMTRNPEPEEAERAGDEAALDTDDEAGSDDELFSLKDAMPIGMQVGDPPSAIQLEFRTCSAKGEELVGRMVAVNWAGVGWVSGEIASANSDARLWAGNGGGKVNFVALYSDETEGKHGFTLDNYGEKELDEDGQWVLLEYAGED